MNPNNKTQKWRNKFKAKCIDAMGGKCQICGYNRCNRALDFHHIDKKAKDFGISLLLQGNASIENTFNELKKCVLLCSNCHREVHDNLIDCNVSNNLNEEEFNRIFKNPFNINWSNYNLEQMLKEKSLLEMQNIIICPMRVLKEKITELNLWMFYKNNKYKNNKYKKEILKLTKDEFNTMINNGITIEQISIKYNISINTLKIILKKLGIIQTLSKIEISKEELEKLVKEKPFTQIGKMFGVSDNAIRKRCKSLEVTIPKFKIGHWLKK